ncbi:hypothetical protein ACFXK0_01630 [Nocardia sp. NPDC059177]|uniref:hypothetical protein n=1 Tax=Nocardia sp. NPDC059177 TaxID=3346759 RepID=UPI0036B44685
MTRIVRSRRSVLGALMVAFGVVAAMFVPGTAVAEQQACSLAGSWSVSVVEHLSTGPVTRTGVFTFDEGGGGTLVTGGGLTGTLTWTQQGKTIAFDLNHNLPPDGSVTGSQQGTLHNSQKFTSTGTTTQYRADGSVIESFRADFTATKN